ncbi:MAG TPA: hypothetical protein VNE42_00485 [Acidimicrobiales bacterium]|nr:hypothetical protein [Acidimicrobiales bacterium]
MTTEEQAQPDLGGVSFERDDHEGRERDGSLNHGFVLPHRIAFWVVAVAFLLNMAFSAIPTPL